MAPVITELRNETQPLGCIKDVRIFASSNCCPGLSSRKSRKLGTVTYPPSRRLKHAIEGAGTPLFQQQSMIMRQVITLRALRRRAPMTDSAKACHFFTEQAQTHPFSAVKLETRLPHREYVPGSLLVSERLQRFSSLR